MTLVQWLIKQLSAFALVAIEFVNKKIQDLDKKIPTSEEIAKYFNAPPVYNTQTKKVEFYHDSTKVAELDATPFIKDGMVNTVSIVDGKTDGPNNGKKVLLITFNTDSGKEDIEIALTDIFDPSDYVKFSDVATALKNGAMSKEDFAKLAKFKDADKYVTDDDFTDISEAELKKMFEEA